MKKKNAHLLMKPMKKKNKAFYHGPAVKGKGKHGNCALLIPLQCLIRKNRLEKTESARRTREIELGGGQ